MKPDVEQPTTFHGINTSPHIHDMTIPMWTTEHRKAWICPKCGRVWGAKIDECRPCNRKVEITELHSEVGRK